MFSLIIDDDGDDGRDTGRRGLPTFQTIQFFGRYCCEEDHVIAQKTKNLLDEQVQRDQTSNNNCVKVQPRSNTKSL